MTAVTLPIQRKTNEQRAGSPWPFGGIRPFTHAWYERCFAMLTFLCALEFFHGGPGTLYGPPLPSDSSTLILPRAHLYMF